MRARHSQRTTRPSHVAAGRLREQLHRDVADLRVRLEEATLRSEVHERTGNLDGVEAALAEQQQMLAQFERRIRHRIADSIVEREAEAVIGGAVLALQETGTDTGAFTWDTQSSGRGRAERFVRTMVAAAAAVAATMLMLSSGVTPVDPAAAPSDSPQAAPMPAGEPSAVESSSSDGRTQSTARTSRSAGWQAPRATTPRLAPDAPGDDDRASEFFEQLLNRLFGAVASVTSTARSSVPTGVDAVEVPSLDLDGDVLDETQDVVERLVPEQTTDAEGTEPTDDVDEPGDAEPADEPETGDEPAEAGDEPAEDASEADGEGSGLWWSDRNGTSGFGGLPS